MAVATLGCEGAGPGNNSSFKSNELLVMLGLFVAEFVRGISDESNGGQRDWISYRLVKTYVSIVVRAQHLTCYTEFL